MPATAAPTTLRDAHGEEIARILSRYPVKQSASMPLLWLAQREHGYITPDDVREVGEILELSPAEVQSVVSFYSMFHDHPVGRHIIMVCESFSCAILGGEDLLEILRDKLGVDVGETTADGRFTLETESCLGACNLAPVMLVDRDLHTHLAPDTLDAILARYQ